MGDDSSETLGIALCDKDEFFVLVLVSFVPELELVKLLAGDLQQEISDFSDKEYNLRD